MEEVKEVRVMGECNHSCVDLHKFCPKGCCFVKCLLIVAVIVGVFSSGYCAGMHEGNEGYGERGGNRHHHMMMRYDEAGDEESNWGNPSDSSQNIQVMYRMMGQQPQQLPSSTTAQ